MNITCQHCQTKLAVPDHKLPQNRDATLKCPKCGGRIQIYQEKKSFTPKPPVDRSADPLYFQDTQSAMICVESAEMRKTVQPFVRQMGFSVEIPKDTRSALEKLEYHVFQLILIDEQFDQNKGLATIIRRLNEIDMSVRRRICLVLISKRFGTNDHMAALHNSVNAIIREDDLVHLDAFLLRALSEQKQLYKVYNESMKLAGRA